MRDWIKNIFCCCRKKVKKDKAEKHLDAFSKGSDSGKSLTSENLGQNVLETVKAFTEQTDQNEILKPKLELEHDKSKPIEEHNILTKLTQNEQQGNSPIKKPTIIELDDNGVENHVECSGNINLEQE